MSAAAQFNPKLLRSLAFDAPTARALAVCRQLHAVFDLGEQPVSERPDLGTFLMSREADEMISAAGDGKLRSKGRHEAARTHVAACDHLVGEHDAGALGGRVERVVGNAEAQAAAGIDAGHSGSRQPFVPAWERP